MATEILENAVEDVEYDAAPREAGDEQRRNEAALAREQARNVELHEVKKYSYQDTGNYLPI